MSLSRRHRESRGAVTQAGRVGGGQNGRTANGRGSSSSVRDGRLARVDLYRRVAVTGDLGALQDPTAIDPLDGGAGDPDARDEGGPGRPPAGAAVPARGMLSSSDGAELQTFGMVLALRSLNGSEPRPRLNHGRCRTAQRRELGAQLGQFQRECRMIGEPWARRSCFDVSPNGSPPRPPCTVPSARFLTRSGATNSVVTPRRNGGGAPKAKTWGAVAVLTSKNRANAGTAANAISSACSLSGGPNEASLRTTLRSRSTHQITARLRSSAADRRSHRRERNSPSGRLLAAPWMASHTALTAHTHVRQVRWRQGQPVPEWQSGHARGGDICAALVRPVAAIRAGRRR